MEWWIQIFCYQESSENFVVINFATCWSYNLAFRTKTKYWNLCKKYYRLEQILNKVYTTKVESQ